MTTLAQLLQAASLRTEQVTVAGVSVTVRELSVFDRSRMVKAAREAPESVAPLLVEMSVLDSSGALMFGGESAARIGELRAEVVDGLAAAVLRLSGLSEKAPKG